MDGDFKKKQGPSDGSKDNYINKDEDDEFGMKEYGHDLESEEEDDANKQVKRNDDDEEEEDKDAKSREEDEEYRKRLDDLEQLRKMREEKKKKDFEIADERRKKKEEEKKKKEEQWGGTKEQEQEQEQKFIAGEKIERKRHFSHKKEEGVFRHKKLFNFSTKGTEKIEKRFKKIHGISSEKKRKFIKLLEVYNPSKMLMTKKSFDDFSRRFKSKRFTGPNFSRMKKEGIDLKSARKEFKKRDLNQLRRSVTGEKDPHRYQNKYSVRKKSAPRISSSGIATKMR